MTAPPRPSLPDPNEVSLNFSYYPTALDMMRYIEHLEQQLESCEAANRPWRDRAMEKAIALQECEAARERWEATAEHRQAQLDTLLEDQFSLHERLAALEAAFEQALSDWGENEPAYPLGPED